MSNAIPINCPVFTKHNGHKSGSIEAKNFDLDGDKSNSHKQDDPGWPQGTGEPVACSVRDREHGRDVAATADHCNSCQNQDWASR